MVLPKALQSRISVQDAGYFGSLSVTGVGSSAINLSNVDITGDLTIGTINVTLNCQYRRRYS